MLNNGGESKSYADCFNTLFKAQNSSFPLIRSFEKIAAMSGNRHKKNWHHFGIGERIAYLEKCENNRANIKAHDRKVYISLTAYFILITLTCWSLHRLDMTDLHNDSAIHYAKAAIEEKLSEEPENSRWLKALGDLMLKAGQEKKALEAYEKAVATGAAEPELANNLAWLLLTAEDTSLRNPDEALRLALSAARFVERGYILDTLATALWANGQVKQAVNTEKKAATIDPDNFAYYQTRIERFKTESWLQ